jgi:tetrapyrrole methylase family protein/MazG family protein
MTEKSMSNIQALLKTIHTLRSPGGCPWDQKQELADAARFLFDEAAELLEASLSGDNDHVIEEMGDLLFMICFCREILSESVEVSLDDIAGIGNDKLIRRHPHVFSDKYAESQTESQIHWEEIKRLEKEAKGIDTTRQSVLKDLPPSCSPLRQAHDYQKNAAKTGFDWPDLTGVWDKIDEETGELKEAITGGNKDEITHELGDILLAVVNLGRKLGVDADDAMRLANVRFRSRFHKVEDAYDNNVDKMKAASLSELETAWQKSK